MIEESAASVRTERLRALTINHRTVPLAVLEQVTLPPARALALTRELLAHGVEAVVLSTCHRTELYAASSRASCPAELEVQ